MITKSFHQSWFQNADPITKDFTFYQDGPPLGSLLFITCCLLSIKIVLPWIMKHRKAIDTRPGMLMINGIDFGVCVVGCLLLYFTSKGEYIGFSCQPLSSEDFIHIGYRYAGVAYFYVLLTGLARPILRILRKQAKGLDGLTFQPLFLALYVYYVLLWECRLVALFLPLIETFVGSFRAAYFILTTANHSSGGYRLLRRLIVYLQLIKGLALLLHVLFMASNTSCSDAPGVQTMETIYGLFCVAHGLKNISSSLGQENSSENLENFPKRL